MKLVYVCFPYSSDPEKSKREVIEICKSRVLQCKLPIAPQIYFGQFMDEDSNRKEIMEKCIKLLSLCDEMIVAGWELSAGMKEELDWWVKNKGNNLTILVKDSTEEVVKYVLDLYPDDEEDGA